MEPANRRTGQSVREAGAEVLVQLSGDRRKVQTGGGVFQQPGASLLDVFRTRRRDKL